MPVLHMLHTGDEVIMAVLHMLHPGDEVIMAVLHMLHTEYMLDVHNEELCKDLASLIHHLALAGRKHFLVFYKTL